MHTSRRFNPVRAGVSRARNESERGLCGVHEAVMMALILWKRPGGFPSFLSGTRFSVIVRLIDDIREVTRASPDSRRAGWLGVLEFWKVVLRWMVEGGLF